MEKSEGVGESFVKVVHYYFTTKFGKTMLADHIAWEFAFSCINQMNSSVLVRTFSAFLAGKYDQESILFHGSVWSLIQRNQMIGTGPMTYALCVEIAERALGPNSPIQKSLLKVIKDMIREGRDVDPPSFLAIATQTFYDAGKSESSERLPQRSDSYDDRLTRRITHHSTRSLGASSEPATAATTTAAKPPYILTRPQGWDPYGPTRGSRISQPASPPALRDAASVEMLGEGEAASVVEMRKSVSSIFRSSLS